MVADQLVQGLERLLSDAGLGSRLTLPMRSMLRPCVLALLDREGSTLRDLATFMRDEQNGELVAFGRLCNLKAAQARRILGEIKEAVGAWTAIAGEVGVSRKNADEIARHHRRL